MSIKVFKFLFLVNVLLPFCGIAGHIGSPIRVLLISGKNNHEWQKTSPYFRQIMEESGVFRIDLTERPDTLKAADLKNYQVIASNWNAFPENTTRWGAVAEKAIMDFVNKGGGFVLFHAASAAHYNWPKYQKMVGATWGRNTRHGQISTFEVKMSNLDHPVTKGLSNFRMTDELWVEMEQQPGIQVLCTAFAPSSNGGRDQDEPVVICTNQGKGRCFYLVLGHNVEAMQNLGWKTLMLRGAEWAAIKKVTQKVPDELSIKNSLRKLSWKSEANLVTLRNNDKIVWQLHFDKTEGKPYFHPLSTLNGSVITELRPGDHPWHRAIWFSWKYINGLNYWEEDRNTGHSEGITELKSVKYQLNKEFGAKFNMELTYHPPTGSDLLKEERIVQLSAPSEDGSYFMDWESTFTALSNEVTLDRTPLPNEPDGKLYGGYAGFSARLNQQLWDVKTTNDSGETENLHGKSSRWVTYQAKNLKGQPVAMTIFDHPTNLNYPNKWYVWNDPNIPFYYFSPAILFDSKLVLKKGEKLHLKYRLFISGEKPDMNTTRSMGDEFCKIK